MSEKHKSDKYTYSGKYEFAYPCRTPNYGELRTLLIGNLFINTRDWPGQLNYREEPLIIHRSQPKLRRISRMRGECEVCIFRKIPPIQAEMQMRSQKAFQVKCF